MKILSLLSLIVVFSSIAFTQSDSLKVGDAAPDFSLPYATKDSVAGDDLVLSSLFGRKNILLCFYPADWSGGCTKEVCSLRDDFTNLSGLNAEILPISGDYEYSHHEWAKFHNLQFKLISDHRHKTAAQYNSYNADQGFNHRTVFLIDKKGKIAYLDLHYSVRDSKSFDKLKEALKNLQ